ncbi:transcriptional regulator [Pacificimonas flava]|uniref:Transcriptional regulator n=2 Tax=Pacificimonas TaxID=1960290 RepID=A0A219B9G5_9SPHN|nr:MULTISPECIES: MerR family DNA-binding transcriptional regulator [Pacificimonas]MBZ6379981.1 MerR family DNA-binding transcriptional regulator [Pacificimonas aurantium]OWV34804.1 transcriptional regulator [Pacificimonas flava]
MQPTDFLSIVTPAAKDRFTIGELSSEFGVTARTIRFYESEGLLSPAREGQARIYSKRDRARLGWILRGKRVGFSLADIAELLDMYENAGPAKQRRALADRVEGRVEALEAQRDDLEATIAELQQFLNTLQTLPAEAGISERTS